MSKAELLRVQKMSFEMANARAQLWILNGVITPATVSLVSYYRMLQPCEMNANLMCPACFELNVQ